MRQRAHTLLRGLLATATALATALAAGLAAAQKIDNVPPAVQNNVAPNFMFMIDNSGSMSNIVPAAPYSAGGTYLGNCPSNTRVPAGTSVDIRIVSGAPRFTYGGSVFRHTTQSGTHAARCFDNNATYGARLLADNNGQPGSYLDAEYKGHYLNWYFGNYDGPASSWTSRKRLASGAVQTRMEIAQDAARNVIDTLPLPAANGTPAVRVGLSTYRTGGGALKVGMGNFTTTLRSTLKTQIDALEPEGNTPLASTFADIGRYMATGYTGSVSAANSPTVNIDTLLRLDGTDNTARNACLGGAPSCTSAASPKPIQYWCQRSSLFAMTDGRPQGDRAFNNNKLVRDYDGDCGGNNSASCVGNGSSGNWDRKNNRSYESQGSDYMDDVAYLLFDVDWRPDLTKPNRTPAPKNNISTYMIGFADPAVQNDPLLINTAAQGGGRFIAATDGPTLVEAFQSVISDALAKDAAAAAVAVTSAQISAGSIGYASSYNSGSWYGDLEAYSLDLSTGLQTGPVQWSLREKLNLQSPASRKIVTYNGTAGVAFTTANGNSFRTAAPTLTDGVINYIRGSRTGEGTTYRARTWLLGDIINAEPVVVNYTSTTPVVFQAANDGMLHVVDGRVAASATTRGQELWAYVPRLVHDKLAARASPTMDHEYLVDGTPATAAVTGVGSGANAVGRILVGGLNKGGAGYYALDITSSTGSTEAQVADKVLWEKKLPNMGYSFGMPLIVNTADGWRVVVTSGLRNDTATGGLGGDGRGHVWVLNPLNGNVEKEFVTPTGYGSSASSLGLAHLGRLANETEDAVVRYLYGGDLQGNVWRVDLAAANNSSLVRIARLAAPNGSAQPVTSAPVVGPIAGSTTRYYVYVGTGQYFSIDDVPGTGGANATASQVQTIYGIVDDTADSSPSMPDIRGSNGSSCPAGGGDGALVCQTLSQSAAGQPFTATAHAVDLSTRRGFYADIPLAAGRVNTPGALTTGGTLVMVVNKPSNVICNPGGSSYFFQLSAATGGALPKSIGSTQYWDTGYELADALSSRPVLVRTGSGIRGLFRLSDKTTQSREINETATTLPGFRRIYKRVLQ